jgi:hypothetical protein
MGKRLLVVAASGVTTEVAGKLIGRRYGEDVEVHVVAPASGLSRLDWLVSDEDEARLDAHERAGELAEAIPAGTVEAEVGDTNPVQAIRDALSTHPADEIVVVTRPASSRHGSSREPRRRPRNGSTSP